MAYYRDVNRLTQSNSDVFNMEFEPGQVVTYKGVYYCPGCGKEATVNERFPPQNHHQHTLTQGRVRWKLVVWASPS